MKKILLFVLILIFPCYIFAAPTCDYEKKNELSKLANDITYETTYVKSKKTFTITLYNMIKGLALEYDGTMYSGNDKNIITLTGINEGTTAEVVIKVSGLKFLIIINFMVVVNVMNILINYHFVNNNF